MWNFHSWNDIWLHRNPESLSGWHILDGTPTGLGPGSAAAIKALDETQNGNVSFFISSVCYTPTALDKSILIIFIGMCGIGSCNSEGLPGRVFE